MQSAEDDLTAAGAEPVRQFVGAPRKRQMDSNANHLRHRIRRGRAMQQVLVPILNPPGIGGGRCKASQRKSGGEDVFTEAGVRVLGIERVDEKGVARLDRRGGGSGEQWRFCHLSREP